MRVKVSDIKIKKRVRSDVGDLKPLMESMKTLGQFHPITLTEKLELVAGFRRLSSAKELGWDFIEANVIEVKDSVEFLERELDENLLRKDFTPEEIALGYERLKKLQNPGLLKRIINFIANFFKKLFGRKK